MQFALQSCLRAGHGGLFDVRHFLRAFSPRFAEAYDHLGEGQRDLEFVPCGQAQGVLHEDTHGHDAAAGAVGEEKAAFFEVIPYKRKDLLRESAALRLYGDRLTIDEGTAEELVFPFETTDAFTVLGKNKVNIYSGDKLFQLKGDKRFIVSAAGKAEKAVNLILNQ